MDSFIQLIQNRHSTRKFAAGELTQQQVVSLLQAGLLSPSSKRSRCWQFVVIDDTNLLDRLSRCKAGGAEFLKHAALCIAVMADPLLSDVWIEDASVASLMMLLQAEDLGLGACWIQIRCRQTSVGMSAEDYVREVLDIPLPMQILSLIAVGRKGIVSEPSDLETLPWEKVHINQFGGK